MRGALLAVLAISGCDRVFGLTEVPTPGTVSGTLVVRWTQNDATSVAETKEAPRGPSDATLTLRHRDGDLQVDLAADGSFAFGVDDIDDQYVLTVETPNSRLQYQLDAPTLHLVERVPYRRDRTLPEPGTRLDLEILQRPVAPAEYVSATGGWASLPVTAAAISVDCNAIGFGLLDGAKHDDLYYSAATIINPGPDEYYRTTSAARIPNATLVQGQTTLLSMVPTPVSPDLCVEITALRRAELDRVIAVVPNDDIFGTGIFTYVTPGHDFAIGSSIDLAFELSNAIVDNINGQQIAFGNPYIGGQLYVRMSALRQRTIGTIGALQTGTILTLPIDAVPCPGTRVYFDTAVVAIPTGIALDGRQLSSDSTVTIDNDSVLSWQLTSSGAADHFVVRTFEITPTAIVQQRQGILTTERSVKLDPAMFEPNHQYAIYIEARIGVPKANEGDFRELGPFWARGIGHTPILTVR